jgi:hypothetical protein
MRLRTTLAALVLLTALPAAAWSQTVSSVGPRAGLSFNPDQFAFGGQLAITGFARNWSFNPNIDLGIGDNQTVISLNADAQYHVALQDVDWMPYFGFGLGLNFWEADVRSLPGTPSRSESNTGFGANLIGGFSLPASQNGQFFSEMRFGIGNDMPRFKLMAGWGFAL